MSAAQAVVLLFHGSRAPQAEIFEGELAAAVRAAAGGGCLAAEVAHLDTPPRLLDAVARCAAAGASVVVVVPMFLAPGAHAQADVPRLVAEARDAFPTLALRTTDFIGRHPALVGAVLELSELAARP